MTLNSRSSTPETTARDPGATDGTRSQPRKNVKILLVEDHEIIRKGLYDLIDDYSDWTVCGEAGNGKEAIEKTLALHPDLVVIDVVMPVMDGLAATKQIRRLSPATKVVMISMYDSQQLAAQKVGANAYIGKSRTWTDLRDTIAAVLKPEFSAPEQ